MSAELLRRAAASMRERAEAATWTDMPWDADGGGVWTQEADGQPVFIAGRAIPADAEHLASWHPAVALAVAKAMDDVAQAWEIADESADGWVYDADDNHYTFEETVDGGWLNVACAYLGSSHD